MHNQTSANKVVDWVCYTENALKVMSVLKKYFNEIIITNFWSNNYELKMKKPDDNSTTIGFMFGLFEEIVSI